MGRPRGRGGKGGPGDALRRAIGRREAHAEGRRPYSIRNVGAALTGADSSIVVIYTARSRARAAPLIHEKRRLRSCFPQQFSLHATVNKRATRMSCAC